MNEKEKGKALPIPLSVDHKDAPPTSSEDTLERALRLYLSKATGEEWKVMQDERVRRRVFDELEKLQPVLPALERMSEAADHEARRLGLEVPTMLEERVMSACRMAALEEKNRILEEERTELIRKLRTDAQTGVASGHAYREDVVEAMSKAIETKEPLWLYAVDVDDLKVINDTHGHEAGNQVLREIAERLQGAVRRGDLVYRPGGDEFLLLCSPEDEVAAQAIGMRLLGAVSSRPVVTVVDGQVIEIPVSVSLGLSRFRGGDLAAGKMLMEDDADKQAYRAKECGKNCGCLEGRIIGDESMTGVRSISTLPPSSSGARNHLSIVRSS